jgi:lipid-binding SYLF domain-containing protein
MVLSEILSAGDKSIPEDLLRHAQCVGIIPNLKRAGFIVGAKYGKGGVTCRIGGRRGWSAPSTVRLESGNICERGVAIWRSFPYKLARAATILSVS